MESPTIPERIINALVNYFQRTIENNPDELITVALTIGYDQRQEDSNILKNNSIRESLTHLESYKKVKSSDEELKQECVICLEKYEVGQYKRQLHKCKHVFHKKCIDKWLVKVKMECPICRCDYSAPEENLDEIEID